MGAFLKQLGCFALFALATLACAYGAQAIGLFPGLAAEFASALGFSLSGAYTIITGAVGSLLYWQARPRPVPLQVTPLPQRNDEELVPLDQLLETLDELAPFERIMQSIQIYRGHNRITEANANEAHAYIELAFNQYGEAGFNATYQNKSIEDILVEITDILPIGNDSAIVAIARSLALPQDALNILNNNYKNIEDDRIVVGDRMKQHENAFHARFHWLEIAQANGRQNLRDYAQFRWQDIKNKNADALVQGMELFALIGEIERDFAGFSEQANAHAAQHRGPIRPEGKAAVAKAREAYLKKQAEKAQVEEQPSLVSIKDIIAPQPPAIVPAKVLSDAERQVEIRLARQAYYDKRTTTKAEKNNTPSQ